MSQPINGNDLQELGYKPGKALGVALKANRKRNEFTREQMLSQYAAVLNAPEQYLEDALFGKLATALIEEQNQPEDSLIPLRTDAIGYSVYGADNIEQGAKTQMNVAMKLPVTIAGALMPDAHQGYGLPIGGVLATQNAVIPYGVGVDIGCRMALSVYDISETYFSANMDKFQRELIAQTRFGAGNGFRGNERASHPVLDNAAFAATPFLTALKDKAWTQLGSSGGGNHFVEFGIMEFTEADEKLGMAAGRYLALLSHSGSRGLGATIAGHYTRLAKELCPLPYEAANLAYLDLSTEAGQEYWLAMNLAGDYASACHEIIHQKMAAAIGATVLVQVENHHNFAWKENWNGTDVIVHRKGATPAGKDVMGIIPGSMATPGFLVRGKGEANAINSASHGAGRLMSRTAAIKNLAKDELKAFLKEKQVTLIGGGMDEAPMAYKNIHQVMEAQQSLIDTVATFFPRLVRMADDGSRED